MPWRLVGLNLPAAFRFKFTSPRNMRELHSLSDDQPLVLPSIDDCSYRLITLDNGLRALVVHDPQAEKGAASCDVSA
jgi:elongation factor P hydroxylase